MIPALADEWAQRTIAVIKTECLYPWLLAMSSRALGSQPAMLVEFRSEGTTRVPRQNTQTHRSSMHARIPVVFGDGRPCDRTFLFLGGAKVAEPA